MDGKFECFCILEIIVLIHYNTFKVKFIKYFVGIFSLLRSRGFFLGYFQLEHVFDQVRLYERFNVSLDIKYILHSMYRATHSNCTLQSFFFSINKDDDRYESDTEGDKHILQIVANGALWLNCRDTTIIKVSQVLSKINIYFYLIFRSLCHPFFFGGRDDRRIDFK